MTTSVAVALRAVAEGIPGSIPGRIRLGNEVFWIGSGLGVVGSALELISLLR